MRPTLLTFLFEASSASSSEACPFRLSIPRAGTSAFVAIAVLLAAIPVLAQVEERSRQAPPFGEPKLNAGLVSWQPAPMGLRTILTVGGAGAFRFERVFGPGEAPTLRFEDATEGWVEGNYTWSLQSVPEFDAPTAEMGLTPQEARQVPQLIERQSFRQHGSFRVEGASFHPPEQETHEEAEAGDGGSGIKRVTAAAVVDAGAIPQFVLDDNSVQGDGTEDDWQMRTDLVSDEAFSVQWLDDDESSGGENWTHPFVITNGDGNGIREHSLVVRGTSVTGDSRIGINQSLPAEELHISTGLPTIRFDDNVGTLQIWDLEGNSSVFFVEDVTAGTFPFLIEVGTPTETLRLSDTGFVGLGTGSPGEELEIARSFPTLRFNDNDGTPQIWDIEGNNFDFQVQDVTNGEIAPFLIQPGTPHQTLHLNATGRVGIGTAAPAAKLHVIGDGIIEGDVALGSSRTIKHEIEPLDGREILSAIRELPIYAWKYKDDPVQASHVGPMAEDVHATFRLGRDEKHLSPADSAGLALAGLKGIDERLDRELEELRDRNAELAAANEILLERLTAMEERQSDAPAAHGSSSDDGSANAVTCVTD